MIAWRRMLMVMLSATVSGGLAAAAPVVTDLKASVRDGQVFLTWKEAETPEGTTFNVYKSSSPVANVSEGEPLAPQGAPGAPLRSGAKKIAHHIERHSARDWWEDPASFKKEAQPAPPVGFLIEAGGKRLDPASGLFVDTIAKDEKGRAHYAVTCSDPKGKEDKRILRGENALSNPVALKWEEPSPIWQPEGKQKPAAGAGKGKPLWLSLHAKGGVVPKMEYLLFGDETLGWRRGLPFKFSVRVTGNEVIVAPTDRVWINRPMKEAGDAGTPAIWTFWYGYNSNIFDRSLMGEGVPTNYTERRNLWILQWVRTHYQTDPDHGCVSGSSMGGCGSISFGLRHPELFAALHAHVPIVSYTYLGGAANPPAAGSLRVPPKAELKAPQSGASAHRFEPCCWTGPIPKDLKSSEGVPFLERMNGTKLVKEADHDLPFVHIINGRKDTSIPWENNPPFYRALNDARQGFCAYWDNGIHSTSGTDAPEDVKAWQQRFRKLRLDESYPAFSNTSSNRNPGDGRPDDGDTIGWMNRGMDWSDIEDKPDHYSITITAWYPDIQYPVKTDVTLRRVQNFRPKPGEALTAQVAGGKSIPVKVDSAGRITAPGVTIPSKKSVRITIHK